jgi:NADH-quinone oxidoreductase subunit M
MTSFNWAMWTVVGIVLGAAYLIWLFQRTMFGELGEKNKGLKDLSLREVMVFLPLIVWAFWIGLAPKAYFDILERPTAQIVERVHPGYYAQHGLKNPLAGSSVATLKP